LTKQNKKDKVKHVQITMKNAKKAKNKIELLAPAGSLEKFKYAIKYGADAVYAGIPDISMRVRINNFTEKDLLEAAKFAHSQGKKIFVTVNIYAHDCHLPKIEKHLKFLKKVAPDAVIISDPGVINLAKKYLPKTDIHLSTQANTTNWQAAKFWHEAGVKRIILAREVTLKDIKKIHHKVPKLELEYFVHGAMCMSYSGRCILSKWMSGQSANEGGCTQPCRWAYKKIKNRKSEMKSMEIAEVQSGREIALEEDSHGTYFFNSKDLNLIAHLKELRSAGVSAFKIEGRNKSAYYVASVTRAYRQMINAIESKKSAGEIKKIQRWAEKELEKTANRGYTKGFLFGNEPEHEFEGSHSNNEFQFVGEVVASQGKELTVKIHNAIRKDDKIEIIMPEKNIPIKILGVYNEKREEVVSAHGGHSNLYIIKIDKEEIEPLSLLRKIIK